MLVQIHNVSDPLNVSSLNFLPFLLLSNTSSLKTKEEYVAVHLKISPFTKHEYSYTFHRKLHPLPNMVTPYHVRVYSSFHTKHDEVHGFPVVVK